jgi:hypothetical protein
VQPLLAPATIIEKQNLKHTSVNLVILDNTGHGGVALLAFLPVFTRAFVPLVLIIVQERQFGLLLLGFSGCLCQS